MAPPGSRSAVAVPHLIPAAVGYELEAFIRDGLKMEGLDGERHGLEDNRRWPRTGMAHLDLLGRAGVGDKSLVVPRTSP